MIAVRGAEEDSGWEEVQPVRKTLVIAVNSRVPIVRLFMVLSDHHDSSGIYRERAM